MEHRKFAKNWQKKSAGKTLQNQIGQKEEEQEKEEGRDEGKNPMHVNEEEWFVWKELNDLDEEDSSPSTVHSFSHILQKQKDHYSLGNEYCS